MRGFTPLEDKRVMKIINYANSTKISQMKKDTYPLTGFTLLEVIIAIFIITIGVGGIFALLQRTISSASVTNDQFVASLLVQEGIEVVRNLRDTNFIKITNGATSTWKYGIADLDGNGTDDCTSGCEVDYNDTALAKSDRLLKIDSAGYYNYEAWNDTSFKRKVKVASMGGDKVEVKVEVFWKGHHVEAATELYNWMRL